METQRKASSTALHCRATLSAVVHCRVTSDGCCRWGPARGAVIPDKTNIIQLAQNLVRMWLLLAAGFLLAFCCLFTHVSLLFHCFYCLYYCPFHCICLINLPLSFQCQFHCLPLALHCITLTFHSLSATVPSTLCLRRPKSRRTDRRTSGRATS